MKFSENETLRFVKLYTNYECLWNLGSPAYKNKPVRKAAEDEIVKKFGKKGFGVAELKQKIKNLRCTYHQECLKIKKSMESDLGDNFLYKPTIKWFNMMDRIIKHAKGIKNTEEPVETRILQVKVEVEDEEEERGAEEEEEGGGEKEDGDEDEEEGRSSTHDKETPFLKTLAPKAKKRKLHNLVQVINELQEIKKNFHEHENSSNEHEAFGNFVAATLRQLPKTDALVAQQKIQDILLKYRLNNINSSDCSPCSSSASVHAVPMFEADNTDTSSSSKFSEKNVLNEVLKIEEVDLVEINENNTLYTYK